jgi:hypothetical protein
MFSDEPVTTFSTLALVGGELKETAVRVMPQSAFLACPFCILTPSHYRADNTCKCDDAEERKMMIAKWGYREEYFKDIPLKEA